MAMLCHHFREHQFVVHQAMNDADTLIVQTALNFASAEQPVLVVADDTDVLVLLVYHFKTSMADVYI